MTREQALSLTRRVGAGVHFDGVAIFSAAELERFWSLARASALEEAAQMCDDISKSRHRMNLPATASEQCAAAIRSEGEKKT